MSAVGQRRYRWEIDPKTDEVVRVRAEEMHHQAFEDFKKVLEMGMEKADEDLQKRVGLSARDRARMKSRKAELARRNRKRRGSTTDSDSSYVAGLTPLQRTRRHRSRLKKRVNKELRKCENTCKVMKRFPPVFRAQCDGLAGSLHTLGGIFKDASQEVSSLSQKIAAKRAKITEMEQMYKKIRKRRNRMMFDKLAEKASRILARRRRIKDREQRQVAEERNRQRSRSRNGRFYDEDEISEDEILEQLAQTEAHASIAWLLNDQLSAAAPPRGKTHIEQKLSIGDVVNSFLEESSIVAGAAKDIIQMGVKDFKRSNIKLIGGKVGEQSAFDKEFGSNFDEDEFVGYTEADIADMKPEEQTRFFAWQRNKQKLAELAIAEQMADLDTMAETFADEVPEWMKSSEEKQDEETDEMFACLMDF